MSFARFSIELTPMALLKPGSPAPRLLASIPAGTRVYLPALPADPPEAIQHCISLLRRENSMLEPVPHIAAQRVPSATDLEQRLMAWQRAAGQDGLREVMVVRGDAHGHDSGVSSTASMPPSKGGPFVDSLALLKSGVLGQCGLTRVSVCGHPEGVGELTVSEATSALVNKLEWADSESMSARVVTQFCFDSSTTIDYIGALRSRGGVAASAALAVGIVGPTSHEMRIRMARRCAVAEPGLPAGEKHAEDVWLDHDYLRTLERRQHAYDDLHVYSFGGLSKTLDWLQLFE